MDVLPGWGGRGSASRVIWLGHGVPLASLGYAKTATPCPNGLNRSLHQGDLVVGESVELVDEGVELAEGKSN